VFVIEGTGEPGNWGDVFEIAKASKNPKLRFLGVPHTDHFGILAPFNEVLAQKILADKRGCVEHRGDARRVERAVRASRVIGR
jgi:hypothetical protein